MRLLNRTTRSVGLTEAGAHYFDHVRPAAEEIRAAGAALRETRDRPAGTLRLSLPWIAAPLLIEPLMGPFMDAYPDVRLSLIFDDNFVDIAGQGFDAGLRIGELLEKDMSARGWAGRCRRSCWAARTIWRVTARRSGPPTSPPTAASPSLSPAPAPFRPGSSSSMDARSSSRPTHVWS
ncbi:hypothetical protein MES4922_300086 [Mesorhizobium ventifaucium]|uniref:LysR substrate-binding domain-containing protein n=1 Tax=Mesorhizobium ventifaucium TaxID=666020 RepID=A0ABN8JXV1_9HYPH|nr:hypothetical protein MES4922_300086 [Mesorhizobium ventifaucium]